MEKWYQEASHTLNVCREVLKTEGEARGFHHSFEPPDGNIPEYSLLVFKFKLIFVRELVLFEKWYQEASHTLNVCREVLKTSGFARCFQHFFKPPDGNIPEYSPLVFKFKLIFVRELVLFEKWYQEASHTLNVCRGVLKTSGEVLKTSGFALGFKHFFKPPDGNIAEYSPLVFKFKLIFVRELVLFEKWYQEASHTLNVCRGVLKTSGEVLKTSGFALGFQHFFKPPDGNIAEYSPLVFKFKLIFVRELVLFEKWYQEASHTLNVCREVLKTSGFSLGFQHFFKPPGILSSYLHTREVT